MAAALAFTICYALYWRESNQIEKNQLDREARRGEVLSHLLNLEVEAASTDLRLLADGDGLRSFLNTGEQADLDRATHRAVFFSNERPNYDQIRFLDDKGKEVLRVNKGGVVVPPSLLQNKADRSYFQKTMKLQPGQIYISALDLNVENGQIEQPYKPELRLSTPVFDSSGRLRGICVINDLGAGLIQRMQEFVPRYRQRLRLLNAEGYWLKGAQPGQEWGFMFPERKEMTMAVTDPELWQQVYQNNDGQVPYRGGFFTWHKVFLHDALANKPDVIQTEEPFLVVASEISPQELAALFTGLRQAFWIIGVIVLLLVAVCGYIYRQQQKAREELDRFFTVTRDMMCIAGFDGRFKRLNPAWERTLGYTMEELTAEPFIAFVHPDDREMTIAESAKLARGEETVSFENRYRCKDGTYRWLMWSARSVVPDKIIFASARDLTERRTIEEKVLTLNAELQQRADQLETANKELEAFSYSVSHDLRAPLRHIHGFVELLQKSPALEGNETNRKWMSIIAKSAKQMGMLIDDLLAFSRTGRAEMHFSKIDLSEMVATVVTDMKAESEGRDVRWNVHPLPSIFCDPGLLRLVWVNLMSNAVKFTRTRPVAEIEIGLVPAGEGQAGKEQVFYVRDNGVGFDMQYASKLFGVFQRLHRAEDFEGTGIGLANVQRIIHRHGGRVWAESQLDRGTTFYFTLPLTPAVKSHAKNEKNTPR